MSDPIRPDAEKYPTLRKHPKAFTSADNLSLLFAFPMALTERICALSEKPPGEILKVLWGECRRIHSANTHGDETMAHKMVGPALAETICQQFGWKPPETLGPQQGIHLEDYDEIDRVLKEMRAEARAKAEESRGGG